MLQTERKEDYFVQATLIVSGMEIKGVPCKIFLPEYTTQKPLLKFRPTKEQYSMIRVSNEGSFRAEIFGFDQQKQVSIFAPLVYFSEMMTKSWGPEFSESSFNGEPQHLQILRHLSGEPKPGKTYLTLWISPNPMLGPSMVQKSEFTGDIKYERIRQLEFRVSDNLLIKFDKYFKTSNLSNNEIKQWSYLVGCTEFEVPGKQIDFYKAEILPKIDDFLIIASLGSRTRTACVGWQACDPQCLATYYRGDFVFPKGEKEPSFDQGLVWLKDFYEFLKVCYSAYLNHPNRKAIKDAIISVVPGRPRTIEESFLSMFAGLESVILDYRRRENLEFVISDKDEWNQVKKDIKNKVKEAILPKLTSEQRCFVYTKLDDLNRISLQVAFERFCTKYDIDLTDLWPLFKKGNIYGLSDIRNKLIHGDRSLDKFHDALSIANENLRFMLERILVHVLGWPVMNTEVSKDFLRTHSTIFKIMPNQQVKLSEYLSENEIP